MCFPSGQNSCVVELSYSPARIFVFADAVRQKYGLTIDRCERDALDQVLSGCTSTEMVMFARGALPVPAAPSEIPSFYHME